MARKTAGAVVEKPKTGVLANQEPSVQDQLAQLSQQMKAMIETNERLRSELNASRQELQMVTGKSNVRAARDITDEITEGNEDGQYAFVAKLRCQVEGIYLEAEQEIILTPGAAHRQRRNRNLEAKNGLPKPPEPGQTLPDREDPKVGQPPTAFKMLRQG